jgi:hypothetical protein
MVETDVPVFGDCLRVLPMYRKVNEILGLAVFKGAPGRVYASSAITCTDVLSRAGVSD